MLRAAGAVHRFAAVRRALVAPLAASGRVLEVVQLGPEGPVSAPARRHATSKTRRALGELHTKLAMWERRFGGHHGNFPDFIEKWNRDAFYKVGAGLSVAGGLVAWHIGGWSAYILVGITGLYWARGLQDMKQQHHAIRRNFPVLGNVRYIFETLRPEIRQYFVESDSEAAPYSREHRSVAYQRAKNMSDTIPMGTKRDVYAQGYEYCVHSMWPTEVPEHKQRITIGGPACGKPYSASLLNISAMSYGALSENAILALNGGAKLGGFYHNTGEGGISRFHLEPGGDIVWNVGTGYFGCRHKNGTFNPDMFVENASREQIKMIEIKLSQGAKPAHGGILPFAKLTPAIAEARGIDLATWGDHDVDSPPRHTAFKGPHGLILFVQQLRELSGGKPVGFKLCVGNPYEFAAVVHAMRDLDITPDFITVDGGEGGTGAAPPEFSNSVGSPLVEGLTLVDRMLTGAGLRDRVKIIASGKVLSGFSLVRTLALGADLTNSARAMMFALGCVQALKCNTNHCPTGITTQDKRLMEGLVVESKTKRVYNFQRRTVHTALEIIGAMGIDDPADLQPGHIMRRIDGTSAMSYGDVFPPLAHGCLLHGDGPHDMQKMWDATQNFHSTDDAGTCG